MSSNINAENIVGLIVAEHPQLGSFFWNKKIDFCCKGNVSLKFAAEEAGLDIHSMILEINNQLQNNEKEKRDWTKVDSLVEIIEYIKSTYHKPIQALLPQVHALVEKVASVHGESHPELIETKEIFEGMFEVLDLHFEKEQQILHPMLRELDKQNNQNREEFHCGTIRNPIRQMEFEHENYGSHLKKIRDLNQDFIVPEGACNSYKAMLHDLEKLETLLIEHSHLENFVLHPLAIKKESQL